MKANNQRFGAQNLRLNVDTVREGPGEILLVDDLIARHGEQLLGHLIQRSSQLMPPPLATPHPVSVPRRQRQKRTLGSAPLAGVERCMVRLSCRAGVPDMRQCAGE